LTVASSVGSSMPFTFHVGSPPAREEILPVPQAGPPGTIFQVFYVGFPLNSTPTFEFYRKQGITETGTIYSYLNQWQIPITQTLAGANDKGWGVQQLASFPDDAPDSYVIFHERPRIETFLLLR